MAEELGTIKIEVQNLGGGNGGGGAASGGASSPQPSPPPKPTAPPEPTRVMQGASMRIPQWSDSDFIGPPTARQAQEKRLGDWKSLWRAIGPRISGIVPGGSATTGAIGDLGALRAGATGLGAAGATIGIAVAGVAALGAAAYGTVKAMAAMQRSTVELARWIGNLDPRIALANANETVSEVNRRIRASAAVGDYAALGIREDTALKDALTDLGIALAPIKAILGAVLMEALTALVRVITDLVKAVEALAYVTGISVKLALQSGAFVLSGFSPYTTTMNFTTVELLLWQIDEKLGAIRKNTQPAAVRQANAWAIAEARSYGGRNW